MTVSSDEEQWVLRYREVEAVLDRELVSCRSNLESAGVTILDHSNRQGWRGEFPSWCHHFVVERRAGSLVDLVRVIVDYGVLGVQHKADTLTVTRLAERFRVLGATFGRQSHVEQIPTADVQSGALFLLVMDHLDCGARELEALPAS